LSKFRRAAPVTAIASDLASENASVRFDKWLWAARFYKTRSLAARAAETGQARLNGNPVRPSHAVRAGDRVSVRKHGIVLDVAVLALSDRRGSATVAALLYRESATSIAAREEEEARRRAAAASEPRFAGRPTKRDRRRLEDFLNEP
jgi:ribosome-associated heat shock protein Hsp15